MTKRVFIVLLMAIMPLRLMAQSVGIASGGSLLIGNGIANTEAIDATSTTILMHFDDNLTDLGGSTWAQSTESFTGFTTIDAKFNYSMFNSVATGGDERYIISENASTALSLATGDFTIEYWLGFNAPYYANVGRELFSRLSIIDVAGDSKQFRAYINATGSSIFDMYYSLDLSYSDSYGTTTIAGADARPPQTDLVWWHICFERRSSILYAYIDGIEVATGALALDFDTNPASATVLTAWQAESSSSTVYIDEFRVSNVAKHGGAFTPASRPFGSVKWPFIAMLNPTYLEPVSGMIAWYDASASDTITFYYPGVINQWLDKSGFDYDINENSPFIGQTGAQIASETLNSLPIMTFSPPAGFDSPVLPADWPPISNSGYTYYLISKSESLATATIFIHGRSDAHLRLYVANDGNLVHTWLDGSIPDSLPASWTAAAQHVIVLTYDGTTRKTILDDVIYSDVPSAMTFYDEAFRLGKYVGSIENLTGAIAEFIYYDEAHSEAEMTANKNYLKLKWGLQ